MSKQNRRSKGVLAQEGGANEQQQSSQARVGMVSEAEKIGKKHGRKTQGSRQQRTEAQPAVQAQGSVSQQPPVILAQSSTSQQQSGYVGLQQPVQAQPQQSGYVGLQQPQQAVQATQSQQQAARAQQQPQQAVRAQPSNAQGAAGQPEQAEFVPMAMAWEDKVDACLEQLAKLTADHHNELDDHEQRIHELELWRESTVNDDAEEVASASEPEPVVSEPDSGPEDPVASEPAPNADPVASEPELGSEPDTEPVEASGPAGSDVPRGKPRRVFRYWDADTKSYWLTFDFWEAQGADDDWKARWAWVVDDQIDHLMAAWEIRKYRPGSTEVEERVVSED